MELTLYVACITTIAAIAVCGYAIDRLYRIVSRQTDYIMSDKNDKAFQLTKQPTRAQKAIMDKAAQDRRKREEVNLLYDKVLRTGIIDKPSFDILAGSQVNQ